MRLRLYVHTLLPPILIALFVCVGVASESLHPDGWDSDIKLREAQDTNADPYIVEINIEARIARVEYEPGRFVDAWTYNGTLPGPLIRVRAGDRLIVHFTNRLPEPTTIHWHGLRIPIQMDGVPDHSQPAVRHGESFTYDFIVPDAGLFWYHPHVMSATQVGFGLYGALLAEDPAERLGVTDQLVLVLSDIDANEDGSLSLPENAGPLGIAFGLEGNLVLVNGRKHPKLTARAGAPQRWRMVNAAKSKYFAFQVLGAAGAPFTVIGGDGGLQEFPTKHETLVIAPGERVDAIVTLEAAPGSELIVQSFPYNRGYGSEYIPIEDLITIAVSDLPRYPAATNVDVRRTITPLDAAGATPVEMKITLAQPDARTIEYRINDTPAARLKPFQARIGETQIWTVTNQTKWSHPIHLHGFFFQVLGEDGQPVRPMAWKDTVDVPFEQSLRFIVRYEERPGAAPAMWMIHCHVLDHADGGLMTMLEVTAADGEPAQHSHGGHD
jgi:FtsP/CotA-like multicopper oxidase with cupredoxin domain